MVNEKPKTYKLGPGVMEIGATGSPVDYALQFTGATVKWDKDKDDDVPVLSGGVLAGDTTYTATLSGNVFQDLGEVAGLVDFSWTHKGEEVDVRFVPATAAGRAVTGTIVMDPIDIGGEDVKGRPRSDVEWDFVGEPVMETADAGEV